VKPVFPELEYDSEDEDNFDLSREILPELVAKEITPPFPAFLVPVPEYEYEGKFEL
jgi:hypothetical protein